MKKRIKPTKQSSGGEDLLVYREVKRPDGTVEIEYLQDFIMGKPPVGYKWEHINGNGLDNRRANLRLAKAD